MYSHKVWANFKKRTMLYVAFARDILGFIA